MAEPSDRARPGQALSFGAAAERYDAVRPRYPAPAVEHALGSAPLRVLDVGAGTGIMSDLLASLGHDVVAVEPDEQMAAVLSRRRPEVPVLVAAAEHLPVDDASVDAVVCAQSFHWFDRERALPELRRVLRRSGVLVATWNIRDHRVGWVRRLAQVVGGPDARAREDWAYGPVAPWFTEPERHVVDHERTTDVDGVLELVRSRSFWLTAGPDEQARVEREVRALVTEVAGSDGVVVLPYRTCTFRMRPA